MAQPSVASFFNTRKRAAAEDVAGLKNRRIIETDGAANSEDAPSASTPQPLNDDIASLKAAAVAGMRTTRSGRTVKRIGVQPAGSVEDLSPKKVAKLQPKQHQQKLVPFIKKGPLESPRKRPPPPTMQKANEETPNSVLSNAFASKNSATNVSRGLKTPTKQIIKGSGTPLKQGEIKSLVRKELNFDEVKSKLSRSAKLQELKASLSRIQELEKTRRTQEASNQRLREAGVAATSPLKKTTVPTAAIVQLKQFDTIELEVLTSPAKIFKTPTKLPPPTPDKNELMSPRHTAVSKRVLFSPAKFGSPSKMLQPAAYQRYASLTESTAPSLSTTTSSSSSAAGHLPLPYKYRLLIDIFKGLDSVCAMFHNRRESITFKKLKPAVQRMLRKNFNEMHLAQIKHLYPGAFIFTQMKMRNYGSASKADYFQLVIHPNVEQLPPATAADKLRAGLRLIDEDNVLASAATNAMNPHVMTERLQRFQALLLARVLNEHDAFLRALDTPIVIEKSRVTRWHPDFPLEACSDIECGHIPQPPNVEKYSSARDILSTARNLFNCATPMERVMERYEAKVEADRVATENVTNERKTDKDDEKETHDSNKVEKPTSVSERKSQATPIAAPAAAPAVADLTASLLKGVPKSLLEKIRAKQAAKALDAMTRRPSQDQEATKYSRLPELARHLRNVFITERKSVLTLEMVIKKIQNSFRTSLTPQEIETHLQLLAKELPLWISFHEVRKTMYLKIAKHDDLSQIITRLETVANEKSK